MWAGWVRCCVDDRGQLVRGELGTHLRAMGWEGTSRSWTKTYSKGIRMSHTWRTCMAGMEKCGARYLRTSTMSAIRCPPYTEWWLTVARLKLGGVMVRLKSYFSVP